MILQNFDLFPYSTSDGEKSNSPSILKARREELGLSQQQVAQGAELLLKQYQKSGKMPPGGFGGGRF